jgi:hypothetical protein
VGKFRQLDRDRERTIQRVENEGRAMTGFLPVGYQPLKDAAAAIGAERLGSALAGGARKAFILDPWGTLREMGVEFWRGRDGVAVMETGVIPKKTSGGTRYQYGGCQILVKALPQPDNRARAANAMLAKIVDDRKKATIEQPPPAAQKSVGGRPPEYDWEEILIEMARINHDEGLPRTQAEMTQRLQVWYAKTHKGLEPGTTELKKRVSRFFKAIQSET